MQVAKLVELPTLCCMHFCKPLSGEGRKWLIPFESRVWVAHQEAAPCQHPENGTEFAWESVWAHQILSPPLTVNSGCCNKYHRQGSLSKRSLFFSQTWRLDVWDPGVGRAGSSWGLSSWGGDSHFLNVSSHGPPSVTACVLVSSLNKDTSHTGLGTHPKTSFYHNHPYKDPISVTFSGIGG